MTKFHSKRFLALFLAASVLMSQGGFTSLAEEGVESAPAVETMAEPETPAPETEPPAPETEPPAPETEPPAPETEPPAPETEPPMPETEPPAPEPEPETPAPQPAEVYTEPATQAAETPTEGASTEQASEQATQAAETPTEGVTEARTEAKTEKETEAQTEEQTEKKDTTVFTGEISGGTITVTLSDKDALTAKAKLRVKEITGGSYNDAANRIKQETDKGHRRMSGAGMYRIKLKDQGEEVTPSDPVKIEISYSRHLSLGLVPYHLEETAFYADLAKTGGQVALDADLNVVSVSYQGAWANELAVVGICDHINDGAPVTSGEIRAHVNNLPNDFAVAAYGTAGAGNVPAQVVSVAALNAGTQKRSDGTLPGSEQEDKKENEETGQEADGESSEAAGEQDEEKKTAPEGPALPSAGAVAVGLDDLAAYSVQLANATSSGDVLVVNVYANADGSIDWTPLTEALNGDSIDVTGRMVLINIAAYSAGQGLSVPVWGLKDGATADPAYSGEDAVLRKAGRVIYNFVAQGEELSPSAFGGSVSLQGVATGMYLAPAATVDISAGLRGSAYAGTAVLTDGTPIAKNLIGDDPLQVRAAQAAAQAAAETETEKTTEQTTEEITEAVTEAVTETETDTERPDTLLVGIGSEEETESEVAQILEEGEGPDLVFTVMEGENPVAKAEGFKVTVSYKDKDDNEKSFEATAATDESGKLTVSLTGEGRIEKMSDLKWEKPEGITEQTTLTAKVTLPAQYQFAPDETGEVTFTIVREIPDVTVEDPENPPYEYKVSPENEQIDVATKKKLTIPVEAVGSDAPTILLADAVYSVKAGSKALDPLTTMGVATLDQVTLYLEDLADDAAVSTFLAKYQELQTVEVPSEEDLATGFTVTFDETKTPVLYKFPATKTQEVKVTLANYYDSEKKEWKTDFAAGKLTFTHDPATLFLTPAAVTAPAAEAKYNDQTAQAADYASGAKQTFVLKNVEPFKTALKDAKAGAEVTLWIKETTVPAKFICTNPQQTVKAVVNADGTVTWDGTADLYEKTVNFNHVEKKLTVTLTAKNRSNNQGLPATFRIKDADGAWLADAAGNTSWVYDGTNPDGIKVELAGNLTAITVVQTGVEDNYLIEGSAEQKKTQGTEYTYSLTDGKASVRADFINYTTETTESITVRKEWYVGDNKRFYNSTNPTTFYLALFSDAGRTRRVSPVYPVTASKGNPYKTKSIGHLAAGTYYVAETDADGVPITSNAEIANVTYEADATGKVVIRNSAGAVHNVTIKNHYHALPDGCQYLGMIGIRKQVLSRDAQKNDTLDSEFDGTVTIQIRYKNGSKTLSQSKKLSVSKGKSSYYVFYVPLGTGASRNVTIYEAYTNSKNKTAYAKNGAKALIGGKTYTVEVSTPTVAVSSEQSSVPLVTVSNVRTAEEEAKKEQEEQKKNASGDASQAVLKLTKRVTYKGSPVRVNSGYYIGIFDDAGLTKLRYKKGLAFKNASEVTASLKINLYKLSSKQVTFYFAEVDKDGKPVQSGAAFGYNVSQNKQSITLNEKNLEDEVVITNDVISGSKKEKQLTNPSSGFAGDSATAAAAAAAAADPAAMAGSEESERAANASANAKTGDETPIALYIGLLAAALAIIIAVILILKRRKRG